jgi:hypothetical protein
VTATAAVGIVTIGILFHSLCYSSRYNGMAASTNRQRQPVDKVDVVVGVAVLDLQLLFDIASL